MSEVEIPEISQKAADNIVKFPKSDKPWQKNAAVLENLDKSLAKIELSKIEDLITIIVNNTMETLVSVGIDLIGSESDAKNLAFTGEAIRSLLFNYFDIKHPMQKYAEEVITINDEYQAMYNDKIIMMVYNFIAEEDGEEV